MTDYEKNACGRYTTRLGLNHKDIVERDGVYTVTVTTDLELTGPKLLDLLEVAFIADCGYNYGFEDKIFMEEVGLMWCRGHNYSNEWFRGLITNRAELYKGDPSDWNYIRLAAAINEFTRFQQ